MAATSPSEPRSLVPDHSPCRSPKRSTRGAIGLSKVLLALITALLGFLGIGRLSDPAVLRPDGAALRTTPPPGDTVFYSGPTQRAGRPSPGNNYVDRIEIPIEPGRLYSLRLVNGTSGGTDRVTSAVTRWNGAQIIGPSDLTSSTSSVTVVVAATLVDTLRLTVVGPTNSFVTVSAFSVTDPAVAIFGENTYNIPTGTSKVWETSFTRPATATAPFRLYIQNGNGQGASRVNSFNVTVTGSNSSASVAGSGVGSMMKQISLSAGVSQVRVQLSGPTLSFVKVRITALDSTPPALTVTAPAEGLITSQTTLAVTGTVTGQAPLSVTVNGVPANVTEGAFTGSATLTEGPNTITVIATDVASHSTTVTRTVRLDTQAPALTVADPTDNLATRAALIPVNGTVIDATAVTVNTNGTPMTVTGTAFAGAVTLAYGPNTLITTATDAAGNATSVVRNVTWDTLPPILTITSPAEGATTDGDSIAVSGTVADATPVAVTVNGNPGTGRRGCIHHQCRPGARLQRHCHCRDRRRGE